MQQYLDLLKAIKDKGTYKPAARANMPGTQSLFGYQFRHNLADGFPLLTTKKISFKNVVVELLWFLRGDTNIKYLVDKGCNIWNEDAYNYYKKKLLECEGDRGPTMVMEPYSFDEFVHMIKTGETDTRIPYFGGVPYVLGDCGYQYGKVWRAWEKLNELDTDFFHTEEVDQISNVINSLRNNPESRRHIVSAVDLAHDNDLALYWCHSMFQFNCRPLTAKQRVKLSEGILHRTEIMFPENVDQTLEDQLTEAGIPKYYLDCHLYQRSCDAVLGLSYNLASYSLLTHILCKMCNYLPGDFIHSFGDVHIYDNHKSQVDEQLSRTPGTLPTLLVGTHSVLGDDVYKDINIFAEKAYPEMFCVRDYNPQSAIKAVLSTGLIK